MVFEKDKNVINSNEKTQYKVSMHNVTNFVKEQFCTLRQSQNFYLGFRKELRKKVHKKQKK